jgi:FkbM family methyltransferase
MKKTQSFLDKLKVIKLHYNKLGLTNFLSYVFQRLFKSTNGLIRVSIPGIQYPVFLRNCPSDTQIFTQIFLREELKIDLNIEPSTIIDGGANIGLASVYLKNRYTDASIFSVEPDNSNFKMLLMNTKQYKNIVCYNNGIWNKKTNLKIINTNAGNESFVVAEMKVAISEKESISAITISDIIKQNGIAKLDLLKLDIEGSESVVFADNFEEWLLITDNILVEIHNWINADAEKIVTKAINNTFKMRMVGEYHYYSKK